MGRSLPHIGVLFDSSCRCSATMAYTLDDRMVWARVELCDLLTSDAEDIPGTDCLILALPIHAFGNPDQPWEDAWPVLSSISYQNRQVVLFGLGSEFCFDDDRLTALENLRAELTGLGAVMIDNLPELLPSQLMVTSAPNLSPKALTGTQLSRLIYPETDRIRQQLLSPGIVSAWLTELRAAIAPADRAGLLIENAS